MLPFLHHRLQLLLQLLERANTVLVKYTQLDLDLAAAMVEYLDAAIAAYHTLGEAGGENELPRSRRSSSRRRAARTR